MRRTQNYPGHEAKIISRKVIYFRRKTTFGGAMRFVFLKMTLIDLAHSHIITNDYKICLWIRPLNKSQARVENHMVLCRGNNGARARTFPLSRTSHAIFGELSLYNVSQSYIIQPV